MSFILWFMTVFTILANPIVTFFVVEYGFTLNLKYFYGLNRILIGISSSSLIFLCVNQPSSSLNWFLSLPIWQPLIKLNFNIYLLHLPMILLYIKLQGIPYYFNGLLHFISGLGLYGLISLVAVPWTLLFELPFVNLGNILIKKLR